MISSVLMCARSYTCAKPFKLVGSSGMNFLSELLGRFGGGRFQKLARIGDRARDGRRRRGRRAGQVDFRFRRSHASSEVAIGRREALLFGAEHAHKAAQASA